MATTSVPTPTPPAPGSDSPANPTTPIIGGFTPHTTRVPWDPPPVIADTALRTGLAATHLSVFLKDRGYVNRGFDPGTSGDPTYLGKVDQNITRGYIRRSAPSESDVGSKAQLNFMYNPESVTRDYVSYLDQEALDPFNTVYGSGNLIAPPSFINFSFSLFFDRMVQTASGVTERGVLEDYDFFDIVVRNVAPGGGTTAVPDNGIMMVNPKDITVVFSKDLTVQGRPTNASVSFERFNSHMVPTRMTINLSMIVTYFGPIRETFTLDTTQSIAASKALIPYSEVYKEQVTKEEADSAQEQFNKKRGEIKSFVDAQAKTKIAVTTGTNVSYVAGAASSDLAGKTLQWLKENINKDTRYTQGAGRTNLPVSADCSGAVWQSYNHFGASKVLHGRDGPANTGSIRDNIGKGSMQVVCDPKNSSLQQLVASLRAGDVLLKMDGVAHCGMFDSWVDQGKGDWMLVHMTSGGHQGWVKRNLSYLKQFNFALRPTPSGSTTSTGVWT